MRCRAVGLVVLAIALHASFGALAAPAICDEYSGGKPPNCKYCQFNGAGKLLSDGVTRQCVCIKGATGTYPKCVFCGNGLTTAAAGDNNPCICDQSGGSSYEGIGCKSCDAAKGYYPRALATYPAATIPAAYASGLVCVKCSVEGTTVATLAGKKVCACDTKKGYGIRLLINGPATGDVCINCAKQPNALIDAKGRCACKPGYGVYPAYSDYCKKCSGPGETIDKDGFCRCKPGYGYTSDYTRCIPCAAPKFQIRKSDGSCQCAPGYFGSTSDYLASISTTKGEPMCKACSAGQTSAILGGNPLAVCICKDPGAGLERDKYPDPGCVCRWGFDGTAATGCKYNAFCKSQQWKIEYWEASKIPSGWDGRAMPMQVVLTTPPSSTTTAPAVAFTSAASWPKLPASIAKGGRFAARMTRCACVKHADQNSQFTFKLSASGAGTGADLWLDGGQDGRRAGDYHDQNIAFRPLINVVTPVVARVLGGQSATVAVPQYQERPGSWLSGMDYVPLAENYLACHNVSLYYFSTKGPGAVTVTLPPETITKF